MSLKRWLDEKWTLPNGEPCGSNKDTKNPGKCRPSKKVGNETPKTWSELSPSEKKKAIQDKADANKNNKQYGKLRFSRIKKKLNNG